MSALLLELPGSGTLGRRLAARLGVETLALEQRAFPDQESYLRVDRDCAGRDVWIAAALERPNAKILPLLFAADLLRDLGARCITLVAPYLPYMRQDTRFEPGEAVTSRTFARLLSGSIDVLVTIDPHLHRYKSLAEIYDIPSRVLRAAPLLAEWIRTSVERPLVIGPDAESVQWVAEVARLADAPHLVLSKTRHGDRDVSIELPDVGRWGARQPVLVDDIISSARTMIVAARELRRRGLEPPICLGVHAVFAEGAYAALRAEGVGDIVTSNTIEHESNRVDVTELLAGALEARGAG